MAEVSLPGTRALTLQEEAQMLLRYTVVQLSQYLREVECNPARGPVVAHALRGAVHEAMRGGGEIAMTGRNDAA